MGAPIIGTDGGRLSNTGKKCWGRTDPMFIDPCLQVHRIQFVAGGLCSEHVHWHRHNLFYVLSGKLMIRTWQNDRVSEVILDDKQFCTYSVPPGVKHQFEGITAGVALETYWANGQPVDGEDIHRYSEGYVR